ncbi:MAG: hypothetical protein COU29_00950 [Candidatus Magasanikbacteria bacterium CG10_big_fil_rev_8_21_14_0_10_36_32]|uniref:CAAX prenyl protease 2/Lysostaphin resistance protein A-like domain-containing protein n=1 Tax=Candidatus Magasanikbacteria bacterium CG10_big_fil_rev_8_21_14_0_10_36_32 TaxID=1974646 RepID=A0A2M6W6J1_9BACT|nr:MAG: hypothetical protein COU29_00950 [Candidatus Magasanikbacteria bacterium CG10_big_fil_rev_8_21_14_0_10_36_32]
MLERFIEFLPPFLILIVIIIFAALVRAAANKLYSKKCGNAKWFYKNFFKMYWLNDGMEACVIGPTGEEMVFRLPIIFFFSELTVVAGIAIIISSVIFSGLHWYNFKDEKKIIYKFALMIPMLLFGIISCVVGILLQTIWIPLALHVIWNFSCEIHDYILEKSQTDKIMQNEEFAKLAQAALDMNVSFDIKSSDLSFTDDDKIG